MEKSRNSKKKLLIILLLICGSHVNAQFTQKIKADTVRIYNDNCNAELILENSTKNIKGFLYNKGNGRTEFRASMIKLNDSSYVFGNDTLKIKPVFNGLTAGSVLFYNGTMITQDNSHFNWDTVTKTLTVTNLAVTNGITASTISGTLTTQAQPNITSVGALQSLTVTGNLNASIVGATLSTADQPNITSVGTLQFLTVAGSVNAIAATFTNTATGSLVANSATINILHVPIVADIPTLSPTSGSLAIKAGTTIDNYLLVTKGLASVTQPSIPGILMKNSSAFNRWFWVLANSETGTGNSGSDMELWRTLDNNTSSKVLTFNRNTGQITYESIVNLSAGVKFSSGTTLNSYEEGTVTPGGNISGFTNASATYTKIGNICYVTGHMTYRDNGETTLGAVISGLPFTAKIGGVLNVYGISDIYAEQLDNGTPAFYIRNSSTRGPVFNSVLSEKTIYFTGFYTIY